MTQDTQQDTQDWGVVTAEEKLAHLVEACEQIVVVHEHINRMLEMKLSPPEHILGAIDALMDTNVTALQDAIHRVTEPRMVMLVQQTVTTPDGEYIPCIAVEGERGYSLTDWKWGKDFEQAEKLCEGRNAEQGIGKLEAYRIIAGTMRKGGE